MPYRKNTFATGYYYHIFNRGVAGSNIFLNDSNYEYCLRLLEKYALKYMVQIVALCLMPNHYHLLLRQDGDLDISQFIQTTFNAYVQALNKQINRKGPLFEGRFKHVLVDKEEYLVHLCRYIHLNPVKAGLVRKPADWRYSDYTLWIGNEALMQNASFIQEHFENREAYAEFVEDTDMDDLTRDSLSRYFLE